jgi:CheY-like chemotaxis protein
MAQAIPPKRDPSSPLILVVEDDLLVRMLTTEQLLDLGYEVLEAGDGETALEMLEERPDIDLLLTDVRMDGLNGFVLAKHAREMRPDLKILFATAYSYDRPAGALVLPKPYRLEQLESVLSAVLRT